MKNKLFKFAKSRSGKFLGFMIVGLIALGFVTRNTESRKKAEAAKTGRVLAPGAGIASGPVTTTPDYTENRNFAPAWDAKSSRSEIAEQRTAVLQQAEAKTAKDKEKPKTMLPLALLPVKAKPPVQEPSNVPVGGDLEDEQSGLPGLDPKSAFAPYGRMIRAKLVTTVDSGTVDTPIIALVTHDLVWHNKILIPANSELHAMAQPARERDRIEVNGKWVVVLAAGGVYPASSEMVIDGIALDMVVDAAQEKFDITDGSAGLRGKVLTSEDSAATVKLFTASFLSGLSDGFSERESNAIGGSNIVPGAQSGVSQGAKSVMDRYAQRMLDQIEKEGIYVRVPSGKQFYLYIKEPLLMEKSQFGASRAVDMMPPPKLQPSAPGTFMLPTTPPLPPETIRQQNLNTLRRLENAEALRQTNPK